MKAGSLALSGVKVRRDKRIILSVDELRIKSGELVGIIGTNGAGKTTLLNVCCGLIRPCMGSVSLDEQELTQLSGWHKANVRRRIGYIPQAAEYNPEIPYTLREVVTMGRTSTRGLLRGLGKEDYEAVDEWIEKLGLGERSGQVFGSLSGGEQQKGLIARAMVQGPEMLLLDEPCSNLDFKWKYQITEIIERLYSEVGMTVLIVSHETSLLPASCSRVVLLDRGEILADGQMREVLNSKVLEKAYGCKIEMMEVGGRLQAFAGGDGIGGRQ